MKTTRLKHRLATFWLLAKWAIPHQTLLSLQSVLLTMERVPPAVLRTVRALKHCSGEGIYSSVALPPMAKLSVHFLREPRAIGPFQRKPQRFHLQKRAEPCSGILRMFRHLGSCQLVPCSLVHLQDSLSLGTSSQWRHHPCRPNLCSM